jgi:dihydroxycyclohexadiene carboxylate dehydrogenase
VAAEALARFKRIDVLINNVGGTIWAKPFEHYEEAQIEAESPPLAVPHPVVLPRRPADHDGAAAGRDRERVVDRHPRHASRALFGSQGRRQRADRVLAMEHSPATASASTPPPPAAPRPRPAASPATPQVEHRQEKAWYQGVIDQTLDSSLMHRYGTIDEQVAPILFFASDESSYITGSVLPVGAATSAEKTRSSRQPQIS